MKVIRHFLLWHLGLASAETQTTPAERDRLAHLARGRKRLVEIGVWHGVTTCRLRAAMDPGGILFAVDPYPLGRLGFSMQQYIARRETARVPNGTLRWLRMTGGQAAAQFSSMSEPAVDFVFIDGDHTYDGLRVDWEGWGPLIVVGGIVALHDSRPTPLRPIEEAGSVRYTEAVIRHDDRFELVETVDSLTVLRRREEPILQPPKGRAEKP